MTERENYLAMLDWKPYDHVPNFISSLQMVALLPFDAVDWPLSGEGVDGFGVPWVRGKEGGIIKPGYVLFDDISEWKDKVKFPDLDQIDFKAMAEKEYAQIGNTDKATIAYSLNGVFMRLIYYMGYTNALIAMTEDPDSCMEFFDACTDVHIDFINRVIDAYHPDIFSYADDIATARSLFISPETYRTLLKPFHKRIFDAISARGVFGQMHTCGYCTDVLDDYAEIGVKSWNSAQVSNDIAGLLDKYKGKMCIEGGWDTQGPASFIGAPRELIVQETRRCMMEYGSKPGYSLLPQLINEKGNALIVEDDRIPALIAEYNRCNKELYGYEG